MDNMEVFYGLPFSDLSPVGNAFLTFVEPSFLLPILLFFYGGTCGGGAVHVKPPCGRRATPSSTVGTKTRRFLGVGMGVAELRWAWTMPTLKKPRDVLRVG